MSSIDFNSYPDYYPVSFSQSDYDQQLSILLSSEGTLALEKHSFTRLSWIENIGNAIKWLFGFGDKTDTIQLNGEVLKFLHYGVLHGLTTNTSTNQKIITLANERWLQEEAKDLITEHFVSSENQQTNLLDSTRQKLTDYYLLHDCRTSFWKRQRKPISARDPLESFGTSHLKKAEEINNKKSLDKLNKSGAHILWAIRSKNEDTEFQERCFNLIENILPSAFKQSDMHEIANFLKKLSQKAVQEGNWEKAESYYTSFFAESFFSGANKNLFKKKLVKLYMTQKKWEQAAPLVGLLETKLIKMENKEDKEPQKIATLARGIAHIYRFKSNANDENALHYRTKEIEYLKKAYVNNPKESFQKILFTQSLDLAKLSSLEVGVELLRSLLDYAPEVAESERGLSKMTILCAITKLYRASAAKEANIETAVQLLEKALKVLPQKETRECIVTRRKLAAELHPLSIAISHLEKARLYADDPQDIDKLIVKRCLVEAKPLPIFDAINILKIALEYIEDPMLVNPFIVEWLINEARTASFEKAIRCLDLAKKHASTPEAIHHLIVELYKKEAKNEPIIERSIQFLKDAIPYADDESALKKDIARYYEHIADTERKKQDASSLKKSVEYLEAALGWLPDDSSLLKKLSLTAIMLGDSLYQRNSGYLHMAIGYILSLDSPFPWYEKAFQCDPQCPDAPLQKLLVEHERQKQFSEALALYESALAEKQDRNLQISYETYFSEAAKQENVIERSYSLYCSAYSLKQTAEAKEKCISLGSSLAKSLESTDPKRALKLYEEVYELAPEPEHPSLMDNLYGPLYIDPIQYNTLTREEIDSCIFTLAYAQTKQLTEGLLDEDLYLEDDSVINAYKTAHQEKMNQIIFWFNKALEIQPDSAVTHFDFASFADYFRIGTINALEHCKKAVSLQPKNFFYTIYLAQMHQLKSNNNTEFRRLINNYKAPASKAMSQQDYYSWREERFLKKKFFNIDPHIN